MNNLKTNYLVLFMITVFGIVTFQSCDKNDSSNLETLENNKLLESEIGFYHNLALEKYLNTMSKETNSEKIKEQIINTLIQENPELFNRESMPEIIIPTILLEKTNLSRKSTANGYDFSLVFNELNQNNHISLELTKKLNEINLDVIENRLTSNQIIAKVSSLNPENFEEKDKKFILAFTQVYNASYNFWRKGEGQYKNKETLVARISCNDAIILADAAGALYGSILGPVSSIVQAAVFSVIANNGDACQV